MIKSFERFALIIIILWLVTLIPSPLMNILAGRIYSHTGYIEFNALRSAYTLLYFILQIAVHIGVAVWLFIQARQNKNTPWIWGLFGLTTGLVAAVLYVLLQIYNHLKAENKK